MVFESYTNFIVGSRGVYIMVPEVYWRVYLWSGQVGALSSEIVPYARAHV